METLPRFSIFTILIDSIKLLPKNGKPMALIALFSIIVQSSLVFLNSYFINVLMGRMAPIFMPSLSSFDTRYTSPFMPAKREFTPPYQLNPHLKKDIAVVITVEIMYLLVASAFVFLSMVSTIIVAAASFVSQSLSPKELFSCLWRTWTRPLITAFYVYVLTVAYFFGVLMITTPLVIYRTSTTIAPAVIFLIVSFIYFIYLSLAWVFAIVVSVVDQNSSGLKALSEAGQLIKGKRLQAFFLNVIYTVFGLIVGIVGKRAFGNKALMNESSGKVFVVIVLCLVQIFFAVAYTVLYCRCKKIHGEEIELRHGNAPYEKILTKEVDGN